MDISLSDLNLMFDRAPDVRPRFIARRTRERKIKAERVLRGVVPNVGIANQYANALAGLVDEMQRDTLISVQSAYKSIRAGDKSLAIDDSTTDRLRMAFGKLYQRWLQRFDDTAEKLADHFAQKISDRSDAALRKILKDGGFSVEFEMSPAQHRILSRIVRDNVSLIKSIPKKHFPIIEKQVLKSVSAGRDLAQLTKDLQKRYGVTRRRAIFIARDQNNKATGQLTAARHVELGITECIWVHSHGDRKPRPTHLKAGNERQRFDPKAGWYDPAERKFILPGQLINCTCLSRPVIPGVTRKGK